MQVNFDRYCREIKAEWQRGKARAKSSQPLAKAS
jgi:hypothetical protein